MNNNNNNPNFYDINQITNLDMYRNQGKPNYDETTRPIGIDMKNFLPQDQTAHSISEKNDLPIIEDVLSQNQNFKTIIANRIKNLKTVSSMWTQNHKNEALQATNVMKDLGVSNDIFNFALIKTDIKRVDMRSDDAIVAMPTIISLASSQYDIYFKNGIQAAWVILKLFFDVITLCDAACFLSRTENDFFISAISTYFITLLKLSSLCIALLLLSPCSKVLS